MPEEVKRFESADGKRRVSILKRADGRFTFRIEKLIYHYDDELRERLENYEKIWIEVGPAGGIYDAPEAATREAAGTERWLDSP